MPSVLEVGRDEQSPNAKTLGYLLCWQVSWQVSDDDQLQEPGEKPNKTYGFFNIGCLRIYLYIPWNANPSRVRWNVYIQKLWLCCPINPDRTWQPGHLSSVGRWPGWVLRCTLFDHFAWRGSKNARWRELWCYHRNPRHHPCEIQWRSAVLIHIDKADGVG